MHPFWYCQPRTIQSSPALPLRSPCMGENRTLIDCHVYSDQLEIHSQLCSITGELVSLTYKRVMQ